MMLEMANRKIRDLKRKPAYLPPKRRFEVFCEGKLAEVHYISALRRKFQTSSIIDMLVHPAAGVPMTLADKAVDAVRLRRRDKRQGKLNSFERHDQVWIIFDRDEHPGYQESINKAEQNGINVARSNPCFELWLIMHKQDYDGLDNRHELQRRVAKLFPEYNPDNNKTIDCARIMDHVEEAERRAELQFARREAEGSPIRPPYTTFFHLIKVLRGATRPKKPKKSIK